MQGSVGQLVGHWLWDGFDWNQGPFEVLYSQETGTLLEIRRTNLKVDENTALLPGLINCHCHLELSGLKGLVKPSSSFTQWVMNFRQFVEHWEDKDWEKSFAKGVQESLGFGVTSVVDVGNSGASWRSKSFPLRLWAFWELFGRDPAVATERVQEVKKRFSALQKLQGRTPGISIHAPYSTSPKMMEEILAFQREIQAPIAMNIHYRESEEEEKYYFAQKGPLWEMTRFVYPGLQPEESLDAVKKVREHLGEGRNLIVHGNHIDEELVGLNAGENVIVHCARSRAYFNHQKPDFNQWDLKDVSWVLGTDSLASCPNLNLWEDMQMLWKRQNISSENLLRKATSEAGSFLGVEGLGSLKAGVPADLLLLQSREKVFNPQSLLELEFDLKKVVSQGVNVL